MMRWLVVWVALAWPAIASAACEVRQRAAVPLEMSGTIMLVPVVVNGIQGSFILDTGAGLSVVRPEAVARFDLALDDWTATTMRGVGGIERRRDADPRSLTLGGVALHRRSLARDATLRVATLAPRTTAGALYDGLLGRDFLSAFDLALDPGGRTLTLYDVHDCSGRFLPWSGQYAAVAAESPADSAFVVSVVLDGVPLRALLDTGASQSLVAAPAMARLALGEDQYRHDPNRLIGGLGPNVVRAWFHRFREFRAGDDTTAGPTFVVAPIQLIPIADMLLGADWLVGRKVWISYATKQLFVAGRE